MVVLVSCGHIAVVVRNNRILDQRRFSFFIVGHLELGLIIGVGNDCISEK